GDRVLRSRNRAAPGTDRARARLRTGRPQSGALCEETGYLIPSCRSVGSVVRPDRFSEQPVRPLPLPTAPAAGGRGPATPPSDPLRPACGPLPEPCPPPPACLCRCGSNPVAAPCARTGADAPGRRPAAGG